MLRLLVTMVLGSALALGIAWYFGLVPLSGEGGARAVARSDAPAKVALGKLLYPAAAEPAEPAAPPRKPGPDRIVVPNVHLVSLDRQDVASTKEGKILFIGREVAAPDGLNSGGLLKTVIRIGDKEEVKWYRRLDRDDIVRPGELIGMIDPAVAMAELSAALAKKSASEAEAKAADAIAKEYTEQVKRLERVPGARLAVTDQDLGIARATRDRYVMEVISKTESIKLAEADINKAKTILYQHRIYNDMPSVGVVKTVLKSRGDTVKPQEPILTLYGLEKLRASGAADVQYRGRLRKGLPVTLEPTVLEGPYRTLRGHRAEVTGVAFSGQGEGLRVVSGSEDRTVAVWLPGQYAPQRIFHHPQPVRAVACPPPAAKRSWCLTGCADGSFRLWDLDGSGAKPRWEKKDLEEGAHHGAITALTFSPDGKYFATGGEDGLIQLGLAETGKVLYRFDAEHGVEQPHQGAVTSLAFTPQARLVSAGRDNTIRVWTLHERGAELDPNVVGGRGGAVTTLGVAADGGRMLFDQGQRLQVLTVREGKTLSDLSSAGAARFETLALFSPDASLILTAGAPEGQMQLWRAPTPGSRAYEVRRYRPQHASRVTSAAFAPDAGGSGGFAVSGTKEGSVYLWQVPTRAQVEQHPVRGLSLTQVDPSLDANTREVRIGVDVNNTIDAQNPEPRLMPGQPVTIVIEP